MSKDTSNSSSSLPRATRNFLPKHWSERRAGRLTSSFNLTAAAHPVYLTNILIKLNVREAVHWEGRTEKTGMRVVLLCRSGEIGELSTWWGLHSQQGELTRGHQLINPREAGGGGWGEHQEQRGKEGLGKTKQKAADCPENLVVFLEAEFPKSPANYQTL